MRAAVLAAAICAFPLAVSHADDPPQKNDRRGGPDFKGSGSELFRALLNKRQIQPVSEADLGTQSISQDTMLIVVGDVVHRQGPNHHHAAPAVEMPLHFASRLLASGGSVLIASSQQCDLPDMGGSVAILRGPSVESPQGPCWKGLPNCPFARPSEESSSESLAALFRGTGGVGRLDRVVAGSPSFIEFPSHRPGQREQRGAMKPLAVFPAGSKWRDPLPINNVASGLYFAVGADVAHGQHNSRFLAFASGSIFNNTLMQAVANPQSSTDNLELSLRVIDFLQGDGLEQPKRNRCIFYEDGRLVTHFDDLALATLPTPPIPRFDVDKLQDKIVDEGNRALDKLQTSGILTNLFKGLDRSAITTALLVLSAIAAAWYLFTRLFAARWSGASPPPPVIPAATDGPPGIFNHRQKELLRRNNVYEPVRDLLRDFFSGMGVVSAEQAPELPRIQVARGVRRPDSLRLAVKDLWRLAYGPPQSLPIKRWQEMEPYFVRIRDAHDAGQWRFVVNSV
jgi:hypothetical protein